MNFQISGAKMLSNVYSSQTSVIKCKIDPVYLLRFFLIAFKSNKSHTICPKSFNIALTLQQNYFNTD